MNFKAYTGVLAEQQECIAGFSSLVDSFDFILSPTSVGPAFKHNHRHDPITTEGSIITQIIASHLSCQRNGEPCHYSTGLGGGPAYWISIAGPHHSEDALLHFGKLLESKDFKFVPPN